MEVEEKIAQANAMVPQLEAEKEKASAEAATANTIASAATKKESEAGDEGSIEETAAAELRDCGRRGAQRPECKGLG